MMDPGKHVETPDGPMHVESEAYLLDRRARIIASMPSAAELDLIAIDPPAEWLADDWSERIDAYLASLPPDAAFVHLDCGWHGPELTADGKCPRCGEAMNG